jgi:hypothetical protein
MDTPFDIVKDSSIWYNKTSLKATFQRETGIYTGTVKTAYNDSESGELRYTVEVYYRGDTIPVSCREVRRWGGVFNYEDSIYRGYTYNAPSGVAAKAGDCVLVGLLGGQGREGVILGGLTHPTRKNLSVSNGPEYQSEFNGINTYINKDGEYTLTFKAQPTNLSDLNNAPNGPVPAPQYDTNVGGSYFKWDKTGSFTISDAAQSNPQSIFMDKKNSLIQIVTGNLKLGDSSATDAAVLGTTYRNGESQMNQNLSSYLTQLGAFLLAASADPVLAALCSSTAAGLANAATQATLMVSAINTFEGNASTYLSNIVKVK